MAVAERALIGGRPRGRDAFDQFRWNLVEKARRLRSLVLPEDAAACRAREDEIRLRARHPDIAEAPFLFDVLFVLAGAGVREQSLLEARDDHDRKLEAFRRVHRHQPDARFAVARLLVRLREEREPIHEAAEGCFGLPGFVVPRRRHELHQVLDPLVGFLGVLLAKRLEVTGLIQHLAENDGHRILARDERKAGEQVAKRAQRRDCPGRQLALFHRVDQFCPERSGGDGFLQADRQQRRRVRVDRLGIDRLQAVHDSLSDAARRDVDDPPQAHVVVRVDDQLEVGEGVLDLLALVETDAADDLVRDVLAHERVFDRT